MALENFLKFQNVLNVARQNQEDILNIQKKRADLDKSREAWDIQKQMDKLNLDTAEQMHTILPYQVEMIKDAMSGKHSQVDKKFNLQEKLMNLQEEESHKSMQDATGQAKELASTDPHVQGFLSTVAAAKGQPQPGEPAMSMASGGTGDIFGNPSVQEPNQNAGQGLPTLSQLSGMSPQLNTEQSSAQPKPTPSAALPTQPNSATTIAQPTVDTSKPPISKIYEGLSAEPFGSRTSDVYMSNPNTLAAMKSGEYLVKKDPSIIQAENPLFLNDKDKQILNDADELINGKGYSRDEVLNELSPGVRDMIKKVGTYSVRPLDLTSAMGGGRQRQEIVKAVSTFYPGYREQKYNQVNTYMNQLAEQNGIGGRIISINTVAPHLAELSRLSTELQNKNIPVENAIVNFAKVNLGHPDVTNFSSAKEVISNEIENVLSQRGATQSGVKRLEDSLNKNMSPQQFRGFVKNMTQLVAERIQPYRWQYKNIMDEDENGKILQPETRRIINGILGQDIFKQMDNGTRKVNFSLDKAEDIQGKEAEFIKRAKAQGASEEEINDFLAGNQNAE